MDDVYTTRFILGLLVALVPVDACVFLVGIGVDVAVAVRRRVRHCADTVGGPEAERSLDRKGEFRRRGGIGMRCVVGFGTVM